MNDFVCVHSFAHVYMLSRGMTKNKKGNKPSKPRTNNKGPVTFTGMCQTVLIHAMNRGQLLPIIFGLITIIVVWRLPANVLGSIILKLTSGNASAVGWGVAVALGAGWAWHARHVRKYHSIEYERMSKEKNELADLLNNKQFKSSDSV